MSYIPRIAETFATIGFDRDELSYFARHILLPGIGLNGQKKLKCARVLVVGAGGLGCPALQSLAGAGVGAITILDGDVVEASNLSRQWLHPFDARGQNKARSAQKTLEAGNPFIRVRGRAEMLNADNAGALVADADLVVDATDDLEVRYLIDDVCAEWDRPWVHAALYRESAQISVFWSRYGARFRGLFPAPSEAPSCSGAGMLGASASLVGNFQALEAIKLITGNGSPGVGQLRTLDTTSARMETFHLVDADLRRFDPPAGTGDAASDTAVTPLALKQSLTIHEPLTLLDLRNDPPDALPGARSCSEEALLEDGPPREGEGAGKIVLICEEGALSELLAHALRPQNPRLYHLSGGMRAWRELS